MTKTQCNKGMNNIVKMKIKTLRFWSLLWSLKCHPFHERERAFKISQWEVVGATEVTHPLAIELIVSDLYTNEAFLDFQEQAILNTNMFIRPLVSNPYEITITLNFYFFFPSSYEFIRLFVSTPFARCGGGFYQLFPSVGNVENKYYMLFDNAFCQSSSPISYLWLMES